MTTVLAALVIVVLLLSVLVAGLLRSHAAILRRLHELGAGLDLDPGLPATETPAGASRRVVDAGLPAPRRDVERGRRAVDITGAGPRGEAMAVRVLDVDHDTLLVFLSTGCASCMSFWNDLAEPRLPEGTRVVVVTRDAAEESPSALLDLAPTALTVVMSSRTWDELRVPGSPFIVHVDGPSGRIVGEGTAAGWQQVRELFLRSGGDDAIGSRKAAADQRREESLDRLLLSSGIAPGDPSLYRAGDESPRVPVVDVEDPSRGDPPDSAEVIS